MQQKIHLPGKLAYENQLLKHHRRETKNFLINQRIYEPGQIAMIMQFYDKNIGIDNILLIHTHQILHFLEALCTGKLETLYSHTSSRNFKPQES